jgi:N-acetylglucosamine malate deacetylase 1
MPRSGPQKILVISAHPDDMEIGMGGTIAKLSETGNSIISVVLTDGHRAPNPSGLRPERMAELRKEESQESAMILGVQETTFFELQSLDDKKTYATAKQKLSDIIRTLKPQQIFTLHPKLDRHPSHRLAGKVCLDACKENRVKSDVWAYEVWGLFAEWDRFEDITDQIGKKLKAIGAHQSQLASIPYADGVRGLNRWRAIFADPQQAAPPAEFAEVFLKLL